MDIQRRDIQQLTLAIRDYTKATKHLAAVVAKATLVLDESNKKLKDEEPK